MRARGILLFVTAGLCLLAGAAQGQVETPATEAKVVESNATPSKAPDYSGPEFRVVASPISFEVQYEFSRTVGPGRLLTVKKGAPGRIEKIYKLEFKNGEPVGKVLVDTRKIDPTHELVYMGRSGYEPSRHQFTRAKVIAMSATAYDPSAGRGSRATFRTSSGLRAQYGLVAVDPRVIPLGTKLFVEGYGFALAADRGSAIKGNRIDLCYNSRSQCYSFGRKKVTVHVLR
jgi:3D (Asp-Asp-Asp) domain-containing protein